MEIARMPLHRYAARALALLAGLLSYLAFGQGVSHDAFDKILRENVRDGQVNYPGIQSNPAFKAYVDQLAAPATLSSKNDKLLYYMNAYNALAIQGIIDGFSPSGFFSRQRFFKSKEWKLAGDSITLHNLEHKLLRPLGDARIHFSIVCASRSCPKVRGEAYSAAKLETQLDDNARAFINDSSRNRFNKDKKSAELSEIFKWFAEDFIANAGSVQKYIAKYVNDPQVAKALAAEQYKIGYLDYNWNLNGTPPK
jgi:Protein of unknown function, DUF547